MDMNEFHKWLAERTANTFWVGAVVVEARKKFGMHEKQTRNALTRLVRAGAVTTDGHGTYTWN